MNTFWRRFGALASTFLLLLLASQATAQSVVRGPYLQSGSDSGVVVRWRTDVPTDSLVEYGTAQGVLDDSVLAAPSTTEHEVTLSGLSADTRYYYAIGSSTTRLAGGDASHSFETAPPPGTPKPTRIWVIGDSGTANANAMAVRDAYESYTGARGTDLWLMLGDNAYPDGTDAQYQAAVFAMYPEILRQTVVWPTLGNHDGHTADSATQTGAYYDNFTLPTQAEAGGVASGTEAYYSFDYGNVHVISLESYETDRSPSGAMMTWLETDLAATDKDWVIAIWHHPPYTKGSHDSDTETELREMRENALPILESYGVDLVLTGHSHSYERSFLLDGHYGPSTTLDPATMIVDAGDGREEGDGAYAKSNGGAANEGAVYAVAGSSGKISGGSLDHPAMFISLNNLGSMVLDVSGNRLDAAFVSETGATLDHFTMQKGADTDPPQILSVEAGGPDTVTVGFSEPLDAPSAETAGNYAIDNGIGVSQATLSADRRSVALATTLLTEGVAYTLTVDNVEDVAGNPIAAASQATFTYVVLLTEAFQDGVAPSAAYGGTRDAYIDEDAPGTNAGAANVLLVDGDDPPGTGLDKSTLMAWDVSDIPAQALVEAAEITIDVVNPSGHAYQIYELRRAWLEDQASWTEYASGGGWEGPGASGASDRGATVLGTMAAAATGSYTAELNAEGVAVVQGWVDGSLANHGLIVANGGTSDGLDFDSREAATATLRPRLTVVYSMPPSGGDVTPPTVPANLRSTAVTSDSVSLAWDAASDDVGVAGYKVFRDGALAGTTGATGFDDTGLAAATTYAYEVTAFDAANNESAPSDPVLATTDPPPQPAVHVEDVSIQLASAGKKRIFAVAQVTILDNQSQVVANATVDGAWSGLRTQAVSGLTAGDGTVSFSSQKVSDTETGEFRFTVTGVAAAGAVYDPAANVDDGNCIDTGGLSCWTGPGVPPTPSGLSAAVSGSDVTLGWDDMGVAGYAVYRSTTAGGGYALIANVGTPGHVDGGLADGTYYYVVTSVDGEGVESAASSEVSATVGGGQSLVLQVAGGSVALVASHRHWRGEATVTVVDANDPATPVAGATVSGQWSVMLADGSSTGLGSGSADTGASGDAILLSPKYRAASGDRFRFSLTAVSHPDAGALDGSGLTWDSPAVP